MTASQVLAQSYTIVDLGTLGGAQTFPQDINNAGQITGTSYVGLNPLGTQVSSFLWHDGVMIDIGALEGQSGWTYAKAINSQSQICGHSQPDNEQQYTFRWQGGVTEDLGSLGGAASWGYGINDLGDVVGWSYTPDTADAHPILWSNGKIIDLGVLTEGLDTYARGINNLGEIVGYGSITNSHPRALLWRDLEIVQLPMLEGATKSSAYKINEAGSIVGTIKEADGIRHPVIWATKDFPEITIIDFEVPKMYASGYCRNLNNVGQVVGYFHENCGMEEICADPFIIENGELKMLEDLIPQGSGWDLHFAMAINDLGQIVGQGKSPDDDSESLSGFLLNPIITGDLDGDFTVGTSDLLILLGSWGSCTDCNDCPADLDDDCEVDHNDLLILLSSWS